MYKKFLSHHSFYALLFLFLFIVGSFHCTEFEYEQVMVDSETKQTKVIPESKYDAFHAPNIISIQSEAHLRQIFNATRFVVVDFFSTECRSCIKSFPVFTEFAHYVQQEHVDAQDPEKELSIAVASVNCDELSSVCDTFNISSYPTINLYENGIFEIIYYKVVRFEEMKQWMNNFIFPSLTDSQTLRSREQLEEHIRKYPHRVHAVLCWSDRSDAHYISLVKQLKSLRVHHPSIEEIRFHEVIGDAKWISSFREGAQSGDIVLYQPHDMDRQVRKSFSHFVRSNRKYLYRFLKKFGLPLIPRLRKPVVRQFRDSGRPLVTVFLESASNDHKGQMYKLLLHSLNDWKGEVNFGYLSGERWKNNVEQQGGRGDMMPHLTLYHPERDSLYVFQEADSPTKKDLTAESVAQWIEEVLENPSSEDPFYYSLPIPTEDKNELIKSVVGKNADDIVFKRGQDTLLLLYSQWSVLSAGFLPKLARVAQYFSDVKSLVVAKMDDRNEHPTIPRMLAPAILLSDSSNRIHLYSGKMEPEYIVRFVKKYSIVSRKAIALLPQYNPVSVPGETTHSDAPIFDEEELDGLNPFGVKSENDKASQELWNKYFSEDDQNDYDQPNTDAKVTLQNLFIPDLEDDSATSGEVFEVSDEDIASRFASHGGDIIREVEELAKKRQEMLKRERERQEERQRILKGGKDEL